MSRQTSPYLTVPSMVLVDRAAVDGSAKVDRELDHVAGTLPLASPRTGAATSRRSKARTSGKYNSSFPSPRHRGAKPPPSETGTLSPTLTFPADGPLRCPPQSRHFHRCQRAPVLRGGARQGLGRPRSPDLPVCSCPAHRRDVRIDRRRHALRWMAPAGPVARQLAGEVCAGGRRTRHSRFRDDGGRRGR
jgi:hypothetical protein